MSRSLAEFEEANEHLSSENKSLLEKLATFKDFSDQLHEVFETSISDICSKIYLIFFSFSSFTYVAIVMQVILLEKQIFWDFCVTVFPSCFFIYLVLFW